MTRDDQIQTVYFDMDGVLSDLLGDLSEKVQTPLEVLQQEGRIEEVFTQVREQLGDYHLFADGTPIRPTGMAKIMRDLHDQGYVIEILTALAHLHTWDLGAEIYRGKIEFLRKNFHDEINDGVIRRVNCVAKAVQKQLYANENSFLIDDTTQNVEDFKRRGGHAFLFDHTKWDECVSELRAILLDETVRD